MLRGLRDGVVTTRWPARADPYASGWRGPATVAGTAACSRGSCGAEGLDALCPTGAISVEPAAEVRLDQGKCILCGRCVAARPDLFAWSQDPGPAR